MAKFTALCLLILACLTISHHSATARIVKKCDAVEALLKSKVQGSFIRMYICLMQYESNYNTSKEVGPGERASYKHGIFQISSINNKWCSRFRKEGYCNAKCQQFLDGQIADDIECAKIIQAKAGFKDWKSFPSICRDQSKHPDITPCLQKISKKDLEEYIESQIANADVSELFVDPDLRPSDEDEDMSEELSDLSDDFVDNINPDMDVQELSYVAKTK